MDHSLYCHGQRSARFVFPVYNSRLFFASGIQIIQILKINCYKYVKTILYNFHFALQITVCSMFVACMAFFAKVSDPAVGGTYMTLLNTLCNLGGNWPATTALWLVDTLTLRQCSTDPSNDCSSAIEKQVSNNKYTNSCLVKIDTF